MKVTTDVWYPFGSTTESDLFFQYIADLPEGLTTKEEVAKALSDLWDGSVEEWFPYHELEITHNIQLSDEEFEEYLRAKENDFDTWARAVRESRERRQNDK